MSDSLPASGTKVPVTLYTHYERTWGTKEPEVAGREDNVVVGGLPLESGLFPDQASAKATVRDLN